MTRKIYPETKFEEDCYKSLQNATGKIKKLRLKLGLPKRFRRDKTIAYGRILHKARKHPFKPARSSLIKLLLALHDEAYAKGKIKAMMFYKKEAKNNGQI